MYTKEQTKQRIEICISQCKVPYRQIAREAEMNDQVIYNLIYKGICTDENLIKINDAIAEIAIKKQVSLQKEINKLSRI